MKRAIFDTNLYVDWINRGLHDDLMLGTGLTRLLSAVVIMELRAGARTHRAVKAVDRLVRAYEVGRRIALPMPRVFGEAGVVLRKLRDQGREVRRASLVNDVLIALTARSHGAAVFTTDATDFEAIRRIRNFELVAVG